MENPRYGVVMIDVSKTYDEREADAKEALATITKAYPDMAGQLFVSYSATDSSKYAMIADVIKAFDYCDILFCNTCGDEIDHLYRFVRAIAKNAGLEIVPVHDLKVQGGTTS